MEGVHFVKDSVHKEKNVFMLAKGFNYFGSHYKHVGDIKQIGSMFEASFEKFGSLSGGSQICYR